MRRYLLISLGLLCMCAAMTAIYYSLSLSFEFIQSYLSGNYVWFSLAILCVAIKFLGPTLIHEFIKSKDVILAFCIAAITLAAMGVTLYLEGSQAAIKMSDAKASRQIDKTLSDGNSKALQELLKTQAEIIDRKNYDAQGFQQKIETTKEWAKATAVYETEPLFAVLDRHLNLDQKDAMDIMIALIVGLSIAIMTIMPYAGWRLFDLAGNVPSIKNSVPLVYSSEETDKPTQDYTLTQDIVGSQQKNNVVPLKKTPVQKLEDWLEDTLDCEGSYASDLHKMYSRDFPDDRISMRVFGERLKAIETPHKRSKGGILYMRKDVSKIAA